MPAADLPPSHQQSVAVVSARRLESAIVGAVNRARRRRGLPPLCTSRRLTWIAASHSADLAGTNELTHESSDGTSFADRVGKVTTASAIGETLAAVPAGTGVSPLAIVRAWLDSPPHRRELLSRRFRCVGVARADGGQSSVVTADFASAA